MVDRFERTIPQPVQIAYCKMRNAIFSCQRGDSDVSTDPVVGTAMNTQEQSQEQFAQTVGERVAMARKAAGLTQAQLSEKLWFKDRQILSNIEAGSREPRVS